MEKIVMGLGVTIGVIAGFAFFSLWQELPLPAFLFFLVDVLGPMIASVVFGVIASIVAACALALLADVIWPAQERRRP